MGKELYIVVQGLAPTPTAPGPIESLEGENVSDNTCAQSGNPHNPFCNPTYFGP